MRRLCVALALVGCSQASAPPPTPVSLRAYSGEIRDSLIRDYDEGDAPAPRRALDAGPTMTLTLLPEAGAVRVRVEADAPGLDAWAAEPRFDALVARDREGPLTPVIDEGEVRFDRPVRPPLSLTYRLPAPAHPEASLSVGDYATHLDGRALLLPTGAPRASLTVRVETDQDVSTTLGLGREHTLDARPTDLRDVAFAVGRAYTAQFVERQGRDVVAAVGPRAYDVRWVGAEIALIRDAVRAYVGAVDAAEHPTLLLARPAGERVPPYTVARSGRGLRVVVREDAPWTSDARLPVAQVMAGRWLGGLLEGEGAPPAFAELGWTRYVAQEVLTTMGTLTSHERAEELTRLEGMIALAGEERTPAEAMARGALYAAALDARLRARDAPPRRFAHLLFPLLRTAQERGGPIAQADLEAALSAALGDEEVQRFRAQVLGRDALSIPVGAFGPCLRRGRAVHRRFALGFRAPPPHSETAVVEGVVAGGAAERAGLTDGMTVTEIHYRPGDPSTPVRVTVSEPERRLEWAAYDRQARGAGWSRVRGVEEERCAR